ncbi:hypothetical protein ASPCAL10895 [Aspergillus calidoustus]|uniref:Uncharacterized protein n=1 Tax=Aspergillus calidoustus TaxID=454130 RepID=A0A0U5CDA6_ASPCI|nr:hypothetical protein ASPCAL10895 [Aspergillus calidoustus]
MLPNGGLTNFGSLVISGLGLSSFETLLIGLPSSIVSRRLNDNLGLLHYTPRGPPNLRHDRTHDPDHCRNRLCLRHKQRAQCKQIGPAHRVLAHQIVRGDWSFTLTIVRQNIAVHTKHAVDECAPLHGVFGGKYCGAVLLLQVGWAAVGACYYAYFCLFLSLCLHCGRSASLYDYKRRDRKYGAVVRREGEVLDGVVLGIHNMTELENPDFHYVL